VGLRVMLEMELGAGIKEIVILLDRYEKKEN
jgi:hypothetical protein